MQLWLDDWMWQTHTAFLAKREPTAHVSLRYSEWEEDIRRGLCVEDLSAHGLSLAWLFRWYLTGFSVDALTTSWRKTR